MGVLTNFDTTANFWALNPQMKILFKDFFDGDKSKNKEMSSKVMWAVALLVDTSDQNNLRNFLFDERKQLIAEDYLQDSKFDWAAYDGLIDKYTEVNTSKAEKSLLIYERKLEERDSFIKTTKYDLENASQLDKIISSTKSIFDLISKLREDISKENTVGETKGSMVESASEKGQL